MGRVLTAMLALWSFPVTAADWAALERHQRTISRIEFDRLISEVYCPTGALTNYLTFADDSVAVYSRPERNAPPLFILRFRGPVDRYPQSPGKLGSSMRGLRIALDPGHIGGEWARTEERFFVIGKADRPVQEAVLNLTVARLLKTRLEAAGARVFLIKDGFQPVTHLRPADFRAEAEATVIRLRRFASDPPSEREAAMADAVRKLQEALFYGRAEIAARARRLNEQIKPDLTLCIHFNAVEWNDRFELVDDNRLVLFVHGNYLPEEIADDNQKARLFAKLLEGSHQAELAVAEAVAAALARATRLPPVEYRAGGLAVRVGSNPYVYARNLAANRQYDGPVIYLEPYYQNNRTVYQRLQLGDYDGVRPVAGQSYRSIFREYADAVAEGLTDFFEQRAHTR